MIYPASTSVRVTDLAAAGEARRVAARLAEQHGFSEESKGALSLVVTEAARNAWIHGGGGEVLLLPWTSNGAGEVDLLVVDTGAGIADIARSLRDGHSTAGTPGTGMGAIMRQAGVFDMYSAPSKGTVIYVRMPKQKAAPPQRLGVVSVAMAGETECGDAWAWQEEGSRRWIMVADGLGHGPDAREAAVEAVKVFQEHGTGGLARLLTRMHDALRKTRGAAISIAEIDLASRSLRFAGVGNVQGVILSGANPQRLVSHSGTVGHIMARVHEFTYAFPPGASFVMHSDGIGTRWDLDGYAGVLQKHPAIAAALIYRDHKRGRDDATVMVFREG